jgi:hypothetical protein
MDVNKILYWGFAPICLASSLILKLYFRHPSWRFNTGYFLKEMISHNQLPLNLSLFQSYQVSAFMKPSSGSSYPRTKWAVHNQRGRPSPLQV